jgi:hypothetical protein
VLDLRIYLTFIFFEYKSIYLEEKSKQSPIKSNQWVQANPLSRNCGTRYRILKPPPMEGSDAQMVIYIKDSHFYLEEQENSFIKRR